MKLRNKKTGEIVTADLIYTDADNFVTPNYSLAELNDEWEDYEEPKASTHITGPVEKDDNTVLIEFYTHEEAEKAVEKLEAWKRLKDKGFKFRWVNEETGTIKYAFFLKHPNMKVDRFDYEDLELLFGGEE